MAVNKVILIGNVGNDPEIKYVKEDVPVARFRLATNESYKNRNGERVTETEWHNIVVWRGLATVVERYVKKGSKLYVEGKLTHRQYEQDGQTKYFTEIVCREMTMLDSRENAGSTEGSTPPPAGKPSEKNSENIAEELDNFEDVDDLPF
ncbi:MAG: single-stranded DNA-binding protein [Bacteroidia bacterium]|nr:MAG: single-stranded DNA-binding protein [Bacteroidia bacterium]